MTARFLQKGSPTGVYTAPKNQKSVLGRSENSRGFGAAEIPIFEVRSLQDWSGI